MFKKLLKFIKKLFSNNSTVNNKENGEKDVKFEKGDSQKSESKSRSKGSDRKTTPIITKTIEKVIDEEKKDSGESASKTKEAEPLKKDKQAAETPINTPTKKESLHQLTFDKWSEHVLKKEGGLSKNKKDRAYSCVQNTKFEYHTNIGITWCTFLNQGNKLGITNSSMDLEAKYAKFLSLTIKEASLFIRVFWDKSGGDKIKYPSVSAFLAEEFWGGGYTAMKQYQRLLNDLGANLVVDGVIGNKSINAINTMFTDWITTVNFKIEELRILKPKFDPPKFGDKDINYDFLIYWLNDSKNQYLTAEQRIFILMNKYKVSRYLRFMNRVDEETYEHGWDNRMEEFFLLFVNNGK